MKNARTIALCGMISALSVVLLAVGAMLGIGMYAAPMLAGLCLLPLRREAGWRGQLMVWLAVSLLGFMLISDVEQNLMYLCLFGLYPVLYPLFQRIPKGLRIAGKILFMNLVTIAVEALVVLVLVPETMGMWMGIALLVLGNAVFFLYDRLLPVFDVLLSRYLRAFLSRTGR